MTPTDPSLSSRPKRRIPLVVKILGGLVALFLVAAVVVAFAAESIINGQKDKALADLSQQIGRPVTAGKISFSLLGGHFELTDVSVGRDPAIPEEPDPALSLGRARINVKLWPIIRTMGRQAAIQDVIVERLAVAVVRLPDGELNWQKLAQRLGKEDKPEEKKPLDPEVRDRVRAARVESIRIDDVGVRFIDLENKGATVAVSDVDVAIDNLAMTTPFAVKITAAILGSAKNFDLAASFGAAPDVPGELPPPPLEKVSIKLEPTALAPLAPFLAAVTAPGIKEVTEGQLAMNFDIVAGSAVPGGQGPTTAKGFLALTGLKFARGNKFDARVDSDVVAVAPEGLVESVDIKKLAARAGDMGIDVVGKLAGLAGNPRVDGFSVDSRGLDFTKIHGFYPALDKTAGVQLRGPFSLRAKGSGTEGRQKILANLDLSSTSIDVPAQFKKTAGTPLVLDAETTMKPNHIALERMALTFAKLTLRAAGNLRTQGKGKTATQSFDGTADIPPMAVRDLVALVAPKSLPDVPVVVLGAKVEASGTVGKDETLKVKVPAFTLAGGKSDLAGSLELQNPKAPRIAFDGRSRYLDVDDFLPPSSKTPEAKAKAKAESEAKKKARAADKAAGRPPVREPLPPELQALQGTVKLVVDRGRASDIDFSSLKADLKAAQGRLTANTLEVDTFGGHFSGAGTELPLADPEGGFHARGEMSNLDVAALLARFAEEKQLLAGRLFGRLDLSGDGTLPEELKKTLEGKMGARIENAELLTGSLLAPIAEVLERGSGVPLLSKYMKGAQSRLASLKDRRLGRVGAAVLFQDGAMGFTKPLEANTPSGPLAVNGRIHLGGEADLNAEIKLTPEVASALTGGHARFDGPVPVGLRIDGPVKSPRIRPADPAALVKLFATALAKSEGGRLVQEKVNQVLDNPQVQKARLEAERAKERATAEADKAKAAAQEQADRARQEGEARAQQARQEAEARAQQARQEAERKAKEAAGKGLRGILGR